MGGSTAPSQFFCLFVRASSESSLFMHEKGPFYFYLARMLTESLKWYNSSNALGGLVLMKAN